eukprot:jgi/Chlat1/4428/Chrsp29S04393
MGASFVGGLSKSQRRALAALAVCGGVAGLLELRARIKRAQRIQRRLADACNREVGLAAAAGEKRRPKVAVDALFFKRLLGTLRVCVPSLQSKEALYVALQTVLLVSRTLLTDRIAGLEGQCGKTIVSQDWPAFFNTTKAFAITCIPAALVNSGLKCMQSMIAIAFRRRLTEKLHHMYMGNRAYYAASILGGLSNADQRITEDVEKFCTNISELFSYTFKPLLDVILFTRSLARSIGYKGQFALYAYFAFCSVVLRGISPPLALMTSQEAALTGSFRSAHQRVVANAEEIAFNDPPGGETERLILNRHLDRLLHHWRLTAFQKFIQQCVDGYMVKYAASVVGLAVYAVPLYLRPKNTSTAIAQLVLVYKRVTALAGHTSRVSELVETVKTLSTKDGQKQAIALKHVQAGGADSIMDDSDPALPPPPPPKMLLGNSIVFDRVTLHSPEGTLLVKELGFEVKQGESVMIMGPNGSGKSSLFRVLAELWPLQHGTVTRPPRQDMFYLSQRPYLVSGTLRDQLLYPDKPRVVAQENGEVKGISDVRMEDARLEQCLEATEIGYLLQRGQGWDTVQSWSDTLSGGEKQRLAMARLLFHRPKFAVLDECTSAVSADGEEKLYQRLHEAGITLLSIAHRPALRRFHSAVLMFDGSQKGYGWSYQRLDNTDVE